MAMMRSTAHAHGDELDVRAIEPLVAQIVARWHPRQIWRFGSRARGDARADSDGDLFGVVDDDCARRPPRRST